MRGIICWSCVSCLELESHGLEIRLIPYDPGSSFTILWSYLLPPKRRINIHTLCQSCLEKVGCIPLEQQLDMLLKDRNQQLHKIKTTWIRQEWRFWIPNLEYREIKDAVRENEEIFLHLFGHAALPLAKN